MEISREGESKMEMKVCKACGRRYQGDGAGDGFCSSICSLSGGFVAGKGDTTKPSTEYKAKKPRKPKPKPRDDGSAKSDAKIPARISAGDHPRVLEMFSMPESERGRISELFTPEERECARRIGKRMLEAERRMDAAIAWDGGEGWDFEGGGGFGRREAADFLGDSDDGSV